jgi:hypothetical protein
MVPGRTRTGFDQWSPFRDKRRPLEAEYAELMHVPSLFNMHHQLETYLCALGLRRTSWKYCGAVIAEMNHKRTSHPPLRQPETEQYYH